MPAKENPVCDGTSAHVTKERMGYRRTLRKWRQTRANTGWIATARAIAQEVRARLRRGSRTAVVIPIDRESWSSSAIHPFDERYGVDTSGLICGEDLTGGSRNDRWNTGYYGVAPSVFHRAIRQIPEDLSGFAFLDLGSGKGRGLMLATDYPFAEITGVELSPALCAIAETNLRTYLAQRPTRAKLRVVQADALSYPLPEKPLVVYLYHPFCRPVLEQFLRRLEDSLRASPRPAYLVYINAELQQTLDRSGFLTPLWQEAVHMEAADRLADRIGSSVEDGAVYRCDLESHPVAAALFAR